jgi:hypothetical protein
VSALAAPYEVSVQAVSKHLKVPEDAGLVTRAAAPAKVFRAHAEPDLFRQWMGPDDLSVEIVHFDFRTGGSYRFLNVGEMGEFGLVGVQEGYRRLDALLPGL